MTGEERKPIKLVHVTTVPLSLVALINGQVRYMQSRGIEVHGVSSPGALAVQFSETYQAPFHAVPMERAITPLRDIIALLRLWRLLRRLRPHIVHAHTPKGGLLGTLAAWLARVPVRIYHLHGLRYATALGLRRRLLIACERLACRVSEHVIAESNSVLEGAISDRLCSHDKIKLIGHGSANGVDGITRFSPNQVSKERRHELLVQLGIPLNVPIIGFIGRLVRDKGIVELVEAWQVLREDFPALHWLVIGPFESEDPIPADVRTLMEDDPRVHLLGFVDNEDMPVLLSIMDILAFPTYREGFPISLLEAAAMEVPVVATRVTGCVDAVADEVTGVLVPPRDSAALAEAIRRYLLDPQLRKRHGKAARERVLRDFQPEQIWEALYQEYVMLLHQAGHSPREVNRLEALKQKEG